MTKRELSERWEKAGFTNAIIFAEVMKDPKLCLELIRRILPDEPIAKIRMADSEKELYGDLRFHGVRFDVFADTGEEIFDVEMQVRDTKDLAHRSRYYQSVLDSNLLAKNLVYNELKDTRIIFLCCFDPFGAGLPKYTVLPYVREDKSLCLKDGTERVFLNSKCLTENITEELGNILKYMEGNTAADDLFIKELDRAVSFAKRSGKVRDRYMTYEIHLNEERALAYKEGREEGLLKGHEEGVAKGLEEGRVKGLAEGREEGRAEGRAEGKLAATSEILSVCQKNLAGLGLSEEEIDRRMRELFGSIYTKE